MAVKFAIKKKVQEDSTGNRRDDPLIRADDQYGSGYFSW